MARNRVAKGPNVGFVHPALAAKLPEYTVIRDCIAGEVAVKTKTVEYLPMPEEGADSPEDLAQAKIRYAAYIKRAVFYNATRRTLDGLTGQVFMRDPAVKIPPSLDGVMADASGSGISLFQSAEMSLQNVVAYSRAGVFVDFPDTGETGASAAQVAAGAIRPTIYSYSPFEIINWRVKEIDAIEVLSLVVLLEGYPLSDDGFEIKYAPQIRVLKLTEENVYIQQIYREKSNTVPDNWDGISVPDREFVLSQTFVPRLASGEFANRIPFQFIGSRNNDANPDNPNFYDIASLNIAHYRNSADYEEACFLLGQPTLVITGLKKEWLDNTLNGKIRFGSRGGIPLEPESDAKLIVAEENTMMKEAMDDKVKLMKGLGAKLVEERGVQRTATETRSDNASESSVLSSCANNVSSAYTWALKYAAALIGSPTDAIEFKLNNEFDLSAMSVEDQRAVVDLWTKGAITFEEMRARLRRGGVATEDDATAKASIEKDTMKEMEMMAETAPSATPGSGE